VSVRRRTNDRSAAVTDYVRKGKALAPLAKHLIFRAAVGLARAFAELNRSASGAMCGTEQWANR
jgi:hypothetical protein